MSKIAYNNARTDKPFCYAIVKKSKKGFTLAEVLITLAVIGVVSAVSIPSLIAKTNNQEYATGLKKFYSTFSQALTKYAADEGSAGDLSGTSLFTKNKDCVDDGEGNINCTPDEAFNWVVLGKYFNQIKDCSTISGSTDCWPDKTYYNLTGDGGYLINTGPGFPGAKAMLADGMSIMLTSNGYGCKSNGNAGACGTIIVDVNGKKLPNRMGRDTFMFFITIEGRLIPDGNYIIQTVDPGYAGCYYGGSTPAQGGWKEHCNSNSASWGTMCTARIMEEGWQMNY